MDWYVSDQDMNEFPEIRARRLPHVSDAFDRIISLVGQTNILNEAFEGAPEETDNPAVKRLGCTLYYEDGHLPPPRQFVVWVDDFELDLTLSAEMPY